MVICLINNRKLYTYRQECGQKERQSQRLRIKHLQTFAERTSQRHRSFSGTRKLNCEKVWDKGKNDKHKNCQGCKGFAGGAVVKSPPAKAGNTRQGFDPWVRKIPWSRKWQSTPVFLSGESHGQRSLAGYSPWGHKEWDTAESLTLSLSSTCTCHEVHMRTLQPHSWTCIPEKSPHRTKEDTCMDYASGHCLW